MKRCLLVFAVCVGALAGFSGDSGRTAGTPLEKSMFDMPELSPEDRVLVLAPHPDDEVLATAGIIQKAVERGTQLRVVFLTYGDSNEWSFVVYRKRPVVLPRAVQSMGQVRRGEALAAARTLGLPVERLIFLGYPDFRTLDIWCSHWGSARPAENMLTRVTAVPYSNAFRPGAQYKGEEVLRDLEDILREFRPTKVFVSHPSDHNSDHQSLYLFLRVALWDVAGEIGPAVFPYIVHYGHWPAPRGYHPEARMAPPPLFDQVSQWESQDLTPAEVERKEAALREHKSQYEAAPRYLQSFVRVNEIFGDTPDVYLSSGGPSVSLSAGHGASYGELPEQLLDEERRAFIGIRERHARLEDGRLVLSVKLSRPLRKEVSASLYVFGYRRDVAFSRMPKLHVKLGQSDYRVYDQDSELAADVVSVERGSEEVTVRIPLELLGNPDRILTGAHTRLLGVIPLDWVSWRVLRGDSLMIAREPEAGG